MPVFSIQTPRGDTVDIDAPDQSTAVRGAQTWDMEDYTANEAKRLGVDPSIGLGILHQESGAHPAPPPSSAGARGPMQLMPGTAKDLGVDPDDPYQNITGGLTYFKQQRDRFGRDDLALAAYNAGPEAVAKHGGVPPYEQTRNYVRSILGGNYQPPQDPGAQNTPAAPQSAPQAASDATPAVVDAETGKAYATPAVEQGLQRLVQGGQIDPTAQPGSKAFPRGWKPGFQAGAGEWYVDQNGDLKQMPGGDAPAYSLGKSLTDPISQPANALKRDLGRVWDATVHDKPPTSIGEFLVPQQVRAAGSAIGDAASLAGGVMGGELINAGVVEPGSRLLDMLPAPAKVQTDWKGLIPQTHVVGQMNKAEQHQANTDAINTALSGARPATAGPFAPELPQRAGPRMTPEQLKAQARGYYTDLRNRGVQFTPSAVTSLNQGLSDLLRTEDPAGTLFGEHRNWARSVAAQMQADPSVENLDRVRSNMQKALATPTASSDPNSLRIGSNMVDELDNFLAASARHPTQMTTATPAEASKVQELLGNARDTWRRMRNVQTVEDLVDSAGIRNATTHMGANGQNFSRQKLRTLIDPTTNKELARLSPPEQDQLNRAVLGTRGGDILRALGNLSPTKGVGALANTIAAGMFGPHGPMVMAPIGFAANRAGAAEQAHQVDKLLRLLAGGGPLPPAALPATLKLASPAGLVGAHVLSQPLQPRPVQKAPAKPHR